MSTTERYRAMNLLVESFLRERNLEHLLPDWGRADVQRQVLRQVTCLCVGKHRVNSTAPVLTLTSGNNTLRVRPSTESVYLGRHCRKLSVQHAMTPDHLFEDDPLVEDLHCLIKKMAPGQYVLSTFTPMHTWIQVPPQGVVLLPGAAFLVGSHVFQVMQAPLLRQRDEMLPHVSTVVPMPFLETETSEAEIAESERQDCIVDCIAPPQSSLSNKQWKIPYERGNGACTVGTAVCNNVQIPVLDALAGPQHCHIRASMGYFWLVPDNATYYQLYPTSHLVHVSSQTPPLHILLGRASRLILAVS